MTEMDAPKVFVLRMQVEENDVDMFGHVNNVVYVRWIQDVAVAHSVAVGLDAASYVTRGAGFVVRRHEVDYLRPVLRGDALVLRTWLHGIAAAKSFRSTEIVRESDSVVVARGLTVWGYVALATGRPLRIPPDIREAFGVPPNSIRSLKVPVDEPTA